MTKITYTWLLFIIFSCGTTVCMAGQNTDQEYEEASSLLKHVTPANVDYAVEWFFRRIDHRNLTPLLEAIWKKDKRNFPQLNWGVLSTADIRLRFISLYAVQLRAIDSEQLMLEAIKVHVAQFRRSPDPNERMRGITFTVISDSCDLKEFSAIALEENPLFATLAINSIVQIRGTEAKPVLLQIQKKTKTPAVREFIKRQLSEIGTRIYPDAKFYQGNPKCPP